MKSQMGTLSKRTVKASAWAAGARLAAKALDFVALMVLARYLRPGDFGLVAMAMTLIFIVEAIVELPLYGAMLRIQDPKPDLYNTAFTLGLLRGLLIAGFFAASALPFSYLYSEPRMVPLVMSLALAPAMRGCASPKMVDFQRRMDFRRQAKLDVISKCIALTAAVTTAILTRSYWSIAIGTILAPLVWLVGSYIMAPMRPRLTLKEWPAFANLISWNLMTQIINAINWQVDRLVLPRFITPDVFGRFALAKDLSDLPFQVLASPLVSPLNVAFVSVHQNGDICRTYRKASGAIFLLIAPALCFGAILSEPLIRVFLGTRWLEAAPILTGLALGGLAYAPSLPMLALAVTLNQSQKITGRSLVALIVHIPATLVGIHTMGAMGAVIASGLTAFTMFVSAMLAVRSMIGLSLRAQLGALAGPFAALVVGCLALLSMSNMLLGDAEVVYLLPKLVVAGIVYLSVYVAAAYCMALWLGDVVGITSFVPKAWPNRRRVAEMGPGG